MRLYRPMFVDQSLLIDLLFLGFFQPRKLARALVDLIFQFCLSFRCWFTPISFVYSSTPTGIKSRARDDHLNIFVKIKLKQKNLPAGRFFAQIGGRNLTVFSFMMGGS